MLQENVGCEGNRMAAGTATSADHLLTESSVSLGEICHVCGRPLLGLLRQGYLCQSMSNIVLTYCWLSGGVAILNVRIIIIILIIIMRFGCCTAIQLCFVGGEFICRQPPRG